MEIAFVAPEITPYSRHDQVADVCAALPKALRSIGHKVWVISPLWHGIDPGARGLARRLSGVDARLGTTSYACTLHDGRTTGGVDLVFVGQNELFAHAAAAQANTTAALVFAEAAAQVLAARSPAPDVVHAHGWFAAATLPLIAEALPSAARMLSLHDLTRSGPLSELGQGATPPAAVRAHAGHERAASLLLAGVASAQRAIAGSQSEALELLQSAPQNPRGLDAELIRALSVEHKLVGVANGLDSARWNPLTDPLLPARFDPVDTLGKARCKDALQLELELPVRAETPLLCWVGSGDAAGIAQLRELLPALLRNDVQLIVAQADGAACDELRTLSEAHPGQLRCLRAVDERTLHRAIAAADCLVLLEHEPRFGDLQLAAQRYGVLPIAFKTPFVADTVVDCDADLKTGTGFTFDEPSELLSSLQRALAAFHKGSAFEALRRRVMQLDVSWERAARRYEYIYKSIA